MKNYLFICFAFVSTAFATSTIDDLTFEWVAPSNQTLIAPELRSLIQTNHSFEYSLLKNVIQTYFNHAEAIVVAKDGNNVCGYCSINKLLFSENAIEL